MYAAHNVAIPVVPKITEGNRWILNEVKVRVRVMRIVASTLER